MKVSNDSSVDMLPRDESCMFISVVGGVRHDRQRFMGKIVAAPHFNSYTVKFA